MRCEACGSENPANAKFCMECGRALSLACPTCGAEVPPGARFCIECGGQVSRGDAPARPAAAAKQGGGSGHAQREQPAVERDPLSYTPRHLAEKILRSRGTIEGERKQVTVLFADIRESMDLAESVGSEAFHEIIDGFFQILTNGVHRFEGSVNNYTGDGIMALFGAPIAHEDHAHRACYAALHLIDDIARYSDELRRRRGLNFSVRIGINSGDVVIGKIGDDLRMDYTAQGHTVGLASRVEQLAAPNGVYVSEHTAALVGGYFRLHDLGEFQIKGVREPITLYRLDGVGSARSRLDISRSRGFSRFVGRAKEMAILDRALADVRNGKMRVIGVIGEAGAGKSRLCYEFAERCRAEGLPVLEAHCVSHGQMLPYTPVLELLRGYFGVSELDDARVAREKIAGRLLLLDESFKETLPLLFDFLGVPDPTRPAPAMEPEQRKHAVFQGLERMLRLIQPEEHAGVVVWEDLHWIDGASDTFLAGMIEIMQQTRDLVVVNSRPGYTADWMDKECYEQISLTPLGPEAIDELLADLLGHDDSVRGLAQRIRQQTAGNPFFIEEVVRAFAENGSLQGHRGAYRLARVVEDVILPPTVHGVLAARIDRLAENDKHVLETAAVVGKRFAESLLRSVTALPAPELAASLSTLNEAGFIDEAQAYPEVEYVFRHPLTQEVAYRQQLASRRSETHRKIAESIETDTCPTNKEAALLAHHWEGAGNVLNAVVWSKKAAEWATSRDLAEARRHWLKVRELLGRCEECDKSRAAGITARDQLIEIGWKLGKPLEEAQTYMEEGIELAKGDAAGTARMIAAFGMAELFAGRVEQGLIDLERAAETARGSEDGALKINLFSRLAYMNLLAGRLFEAHRLIDVAYELARKAPTQPGAPMTSPEWYRGFKSLLSVYSGDVRSAHAAVQQALAAARAGHDRPNECMLHGFSVTLAWFTGDVEAGLQHARQQVALAEQLGTPSLVSGAYDSLGVANTLAGRWSEAVGYAERALQTARTSGTLLQSEAVFASNLAAAYLGKGEVALARKCAQEAVEIARRRGTPLFECRSRLVLARALLAGEADLARASEVLDEAMAIVERTGARGYEPFLRAERARIAELVGDEIGCAREVAAAEKMFLHMGADAHVARLRGAGEHAAAS